MKSLYFKIIKENMTFLLFLVLFAFAKNSNAQEYTHTLDDIITNAIDHIQFEIFMKDTFIEEWTKLNERLDNQNCQSLDVHDLDPTTHNLIIDSLYISDLPPFLGEPYSIPSASMSVLEYIEKNNDSLFHPLMNTWISEPNDVFKKSPFQKISDINICSSVDRKADSIPELPLKAFLSSVYENKSLFCIEIGLSHSTLGNACKYTYSIDILLFMNKKNLEVVEYGIGNSIGLPEKFKSKVSVNY